MICRNQRGQDALFKIVWGKDSVLIIPGYIPAPISGSDSIPSEVHAFLATRTLVIVTVMAFRPEYVSDLLIDAVKQVSIDYPNIGLVILASGGDAGAHLVMQNCRAVA